MGSTHAGFKAGDQTTQGLGVRIPVCVWIRTESSDEVYDGMIRFKG
jgi:hypothetical protein